MALLYLALFAIGLVALMTFLRRWADAFVMIAFAIGCAVGSNLYHPFAFPIEVGGIVFGIDSILYTVFIYLVAVKYLHYEKKESRLFVYSALVAIVVSAIFEFVAKLISQGYSIETLQNFLSYLVSAAASVVAIYLMELFFSYTHKKGLSNYIAIPVSLVIGSFVNSAVYYFIMFGINGKIYENFWPILLGSLIGKAFTICLCEISYSLNDEKRWCPEELQLDENKDKII